MLAMTSPKVGKGEVMNAGAGERHSVNEIAKMFGGETKRIDARPGEARDTLADISLTTELIGWEPNVKFNDGLRELLEENGIEAK
jgi:UDP-glucose 4-epimerase